MKRTTATTAVAVEKSANGKTGTMSVTHASQASCPDSCALKNAGCYAESGTQAFTTRRLNRAPIESPESIASTEATAIDSLSGKNHLRLHVVGDATTNVAAQTVSAAAERHMAKHGKKAFTYTHAWEQVERSSWRSVSVLASCDSPQDIDTANSNGYAAALVVDEFDSKKLGANGVKGGLPCLQQTGLAKDCNSCGVCMDDQKLLNHPTGPITILFSAHSGGTKKLDALRAALRKRHSNK